MTAKPDTPQDLGKRQGVQDLDPAQAERLHQLRQALGLSVNDMAQRLGLWGANGADNLRQMERCARPLPGTLQVLLGYMEREQAENARKLGQLSDFRESEIIAGRIRKLSGE
jgi:transcriptional regulator with XRE-family HTH domain